ncbi:MAG: M28 family metallopeptidase [Candidatus Sphingomonas colombiensis]|nr:M28 family metallopeptidase [Sphingomonas sp.]WEK44441.1 MAG: M28 family metallopeptidase [Sphingomonas sp.]
MKAIPLLARVAVIALLPLSVTLSAQETTPAGVNVAVNAPLPADQAALKAHVMFLASDAMKGREAGSGEYDIAAQYVASRFYAAGLRPGGDAGGYLQAVPLVSYRPEGSGRVVRTVDGKTETLVAGTDYAALADPRRAKVSLNGEIVFVGFGVSAPDRGRDDYAGVDVKGKIVAILPGTPRDMNAEERAYLGGGDTKAKAAAAHGAIGMILLAAPGSTEKTPFARTAERIAKPRMTYAEPDGTGHGDAPIPTVATFSETGAAKLFAGARAQWPALVKEAKKKLPRYASQPLPGMVQLETASSYDKATSSNVVGVIPGRDPVLSKEVLVLSAHLDHIGITAPDERGDTINNGALDDAIGIASLIEEANRFKEKAPRRTILFVAFTAEEKGLIGSAWFTTHPTVPIDTIVVDVNLDMPILTYKFEDMVAFGGDRSTLGPVIARATGAIGVSMSPDPMPDEAIFVRSDHFNFVRRGIPSVFLWPGQKGPGKEAVATFMSKHYHRPSDDLTQPIMWDQAVRFVDANYRIAREIADADARPVWNKGDYFGTLFNGPMAR